MAEVEQLVLTTSRALLVFIGLGLAAWMDHKERRVPNEHWVRWGKPAIFIWAFEILLNDGNIAILLTASAVVAYASGSVFGRPTIQDVKSGSKVDAFVFLWYIASFAGVVWGVILYQNTNIIDVLTGQAEELAAMWWQTLGLLFVMILIDFAWRFRLLHGGADAKALMWVSLMYPTWASIELFQIIDESSTSLTLPPSFSLLMWGAMVFLLIPVYMLIRNFSQKNIASFSDLRLAWHSTMIPIDEVENRHVWMLTKIIVGGDGEKKIHHASRAPKFTPSVDEVKSQVAELREMGVDSVWISFKIPLLVFLFPALIPLMLFGDPTGLVLSKLL